MLGRIIAVLLLAASLPTRANTLMADASDLWWNPDEPGWGVNIVHQADKLFATLFVYGPAGEPAWYVASDMSLGEGTTFSGPLYRTRGPWFGGSFDPAAVQVTRVGTATFTYRPVDRATFTYDVDGVTVTKNVERQTFRTNPLSGPYYGAFAGTYVGDCEINAYREEIVDIEIEHVDPSITIQVAFTGESCTLSGTYSQAGRMGTATGTVDCGNGPLGPFALTEIEATRNAVSAVGSIEYEGCRWRGRLGVVRIGEMLP